MMLKEIKKERNIAAAFFQLTQFSNINGNDNE